MTKYSHLREYIIYLSFLLYFNAWIVFPNLRPPEDHRQRTYVRLPSSKRRYREAY